MWMKEYVFNLLIQPFHLILYTMLVGSALDFAVDNMIYAIVALGFVFEAEKILKRFFGFNKAETMDTNGSAIGGALAMAGINQLRKLAGPKGKKGGDGKGAGSGSGDDSGGSSRKPRTRELLEGGDRSGSGRGRGSNSPYTQAQIDNNGNISDSTRSQRQHALNRSKMSATGQRLAAERARLTRNYNRATTDAGRKKNLRLMRQLKESDNRGLGQAMRDKLYGSRRFAELTASRPARIVRGAGRGIKKVSELPGRAVRNLPKPLRNTIRGATSVVGKAAAYAAPKIGSAALKGGLAATAAGIGIAGGLASSDSRNILKYGAAGAAAGVVAGGGMIGMAKGASDFIEDAGETAASTYTTAAKGPAAEKERQQAIEDRQAMRDKDRQRLYESELGIPHSEVKDVMEDAQVFRENGITDDELIIKAMKEQGFGNERASQERLILAGLASETGNDNKKIGDLENRLKERFDDATVKKYIDGVRNITGAV